MIQRSRLIGRIVVLELALEALHLSQNPAVIFWAFQHPLAGVQQPLANAGKDIVRDENAVTCSSTLPATNVLGGTGFIRAGDAFAHEGNSRYRLVGIETLRPRSGQPQDT